jgi:hypothetical protein
MEFRRFQPVAQGIALAELADEGESQDTGEREQQQQRKPVAV